MAGFTDSALEKKLAELNGSQQSIQTLALWLIHHRKHHKPIVQVWFRELRKTKPNRKLTFMYLANDVIQNSKKKGPEFSQEFSTILGKAFTHVCHAVSDEKTKKGLERIIKVWQERNIYDKAKIQELRDAVHEKKKKHETNASKVSEKVKERVTEKVKERVAEKVKERVTEKVKEKAVEKRKSLGDKSHSDSDHNIKKKKLQAKEEAEIKVTRSPVVNPPDAETLIKIILDLENSPSTDAEVREKIASLPPEVSDITLLEKLHGRESAEKLAKQVEEACVLLIDYNNRLSEELENRKGISKMLSACVQRENESQISSMEKIEEYRDKLKRVIQVKNELKSHLQNLPDLTLLPSVTGGLAPLPSAGDLFN